MRKHTGFAAAAIMGLAVAAASTGVFAQEGTALEELTFDDAVEAALTDAGLTQDGVTFSKKMSDYENGVSIYEIDFLIPGETKYDYKIDALTGAVLEKEADPWEAEDDVDYKALLDQKANYFDFYSDDAMVVMAPAMSTALEKAAPADEENVHYYKTGMEYDDGRIFYEVGLLIPGEAKHSYKFDATTGDMFQEETEPWEADDDREYDGLLKRAAEQAAAYAASAVPDAAQFTEESAKAAALKDAGFAESEVTLIKCGKDFDDGVEIFEVDFIGPDGMEYDYDISTADGSILGKDVDLDD